MFFFFRCHENVRLFQLLPAMNFSSETFFAPLQKFPLEVPKIIFSALLPFLLPTLHLEESIHFLKLVNKR